MDEKIDQKFTKIPPRPSERAKHKALRSKMVGNETHRSYGERLKGAKNLETLRGKKTQDRLK